MDLQYYLLLLLSTVFANHVVLMRMLGLCPFMGVSTPPAAALAIGGATAGVLTLAAGGSQLLAALAPGYPRTLCFSLILASGVLLGGLLLHKLKHVPRLALGLYLPLLSANGVLLGVPLLESQTRHGITGALLIGLGAALGFTLLLALFGALCERLEGADVPPPWRGTPIALLTAGLMGLALSGFGGLLR